MHDTTRIGLIRNKSIWRKDQKEAVERERYQAWAWLLFGWVASSHLPAGLLQFASQRTVHVNIIKKDFFSHNTENTLRLHNTENTLRLHYKDQMRNDIREPISDYSEYHMKHGNTLCRQNVKYFHVKAGCM
jgi:ribosomal protein L28